ncbi:MAG: carbohydrate ABC transporter permease [Chloroflexia bacterium]|nr:carbohydrate ABC transporter permease [Chloroflexia bacterium]
MVVYVLLTVVTLVALFPLFWTLSTSLTPRELVYQWPPKIWPSSPTLGAYTDIIGQRQFLVSFANSFIVSVGTVVLSLVAGTLAAYRFARSRFPGKNFILFMLIATTMIPGLSNLIPLYVLMRNIGLLNTHLALILIYTASFLPLVVWLMKGFIESIPEELDESAIIDGASRWQVLIRIILPLSGPGLAAAATLTFVAAWNEFLVALTMIQTPDQRTIQPTIQLFVGYYEQTEWTLIAAATLIACVPVVILFLLLQRALIAGLTAGAVKG